MADSTNKELDLAKIYNRFVKDYNKKDDPYAVITGLSTLCDECDRYINGLQDSLDAVIHEFQDSLDNEWLRTVERNENGDITSESNQAKREVNKIIKRVKGQLGWSMHIDPKLFNQWIDEAIEGNIDKTITSIFILRINQYADRLKKVKSNKRAFTATLNLIIEKGRPEKLDLWDELPVVKKQEITGVELHEKLVNLGKEWEITKKLVIDKGVEVIQESGKPLSYFLTEKRGDANAKLYKKVLEYFESIGNPLIKRTVMKYLSDALHDGIIQEKLE